MNHSGAVKTNGPKIWIDLDNSPHVPFFKPIIGQLQRNGFMTVLTARDCFQVCGLADRLNIPYKKIGRHYGKNMLMKVTGLLIRCLELLPTALKEKPDIALSHGSRSQVMAAAVLNIPSIVLADYEYTRTVVKPSAMIVPEMIPSHTFEPFTKTVLTYPGIKEDVYVPDFNPDGSILEELGIGKDDLMVTVRPPATEAHYHNPESEHLFESTINYLGEHQNTRIIVLPRHEKKQTAWVKENWSEWYRSGKIVIPDHVVEGLNLIWHSDLVISGGGTMNREAAALGIPVYSIFRGKIGAIDRYLSDTGRLTLIENDHDVRNKILLQKNKRNHNRNQNEHLTLDTIIRHLTTITETRQTAKG